MLIKSQPLLCCFLIEPACGRSIVFIPHPPASPISKRHQQTPSAMPTDRQYCWHRKEPPRLILLVGGSRWGLAPERGPWAGAMRQLVLKCGNQKICDWTIWQVDVALNAFAHCRSAFEGNPSLGSCFHILEGSRAHFPFSLFPPLFPSRSLFLVFFSAVVATTPRLPTFTASPGGNW